MRIKKEILIIIILDLISLIVSWGVFYAFKIQSGWFEFQIRPDFLLPMIVMNLYWQIIFSLLGLYRKWHLKSRLDELSAVFKALTIGALIFYSMIAFEDSSVATSINSRTSMIMYWGILFLLIGGSRFIFRSINRRLLLRGIGLENALVIGTPKLSKKLFDDVNAFPLLGYKTIGIVSLQKKIDTNEKHYIGSIEDLNKIIKQNKILHVLIALESTQHKIMLEIISKCPTNISMKIIPDMYDIISGQARTNQLYGFPLIEIMPLVLQPWEIILKRILDITVSILILIISLPLWLLIAVAIKINSRGPIVFNQERVGKDENMFFMHKFRTMNQDAEKHSGPIWSQKDDPRITSVGNFLRRTRLDEIPQFINVLSGEMSLVGPRPERPFFIEKLEKEIPLYKRRLQVRPGITGWAQIKQGYDTSIDDVRSKVKFDLYYIENMSLQMDLKILLFTFYTMIRGRGQ